MKPSPQVVRKLLEKAMIRQLEVKVKASLLLIRAHKD